MIKYLVIENDDKLRILGEFNHLDDAVRVLEVYQKTGVDVHLYKLMNTKVINA